jgi:Na+/melibiose symporter-like transporter
MIGSFRIIYGIAASLCAVAGIIVAVSLFIPDRAPQSSQFLIITIIVIGIFGVVGILLFGIQLHLSRIAKITQVTDGKSANALRKTWFWLLVNLILGGLALNAVLLLATYAILARIDQGFAVFG